MTDEQDRLVESPMTQCGYSLQNIRLGIFEAPVFFESDEVALKAYASMLHPVKTSPSENVRSLLADLQLVSVGDWIEDGTFKPAKPPRFLASAKDLPYARA